MIPNNEHKENTCAYCGSPLREGAASCDVCGAVVQNGGAPVHLPEESSSTVLFTKIREWFAKPSNRKKAAVIAAVCIACIVVTAAVMLLHAAISGGSSKSSSDVVGSSKSSSDVVSSDNQSENNYGSVGKVIATEQLAAADSELSAADTAEASPTAQPTPVITQNTTVIADYYVVNCDEYVTLRNEPSTSAKELAKLPLGQKVGYIENSENGFVKINYNGIIGYVLFTYLSENEPQPISYSSPVFTAAEASSVRSSMRDSSGSTVSYAPANVLDGKNTTCWAMDVTTGIEPVITLRAKTKQHITGIKFSDGYFKSQHLYDANRKVTKVEISYDGGSVVYECVGAQFAVLQNVQLPTPADSSYITLRVLESTAATYDDLCISRIEAY